MTKKTSQKDLLKQVEKNIKKNGLIKSKDTVIVAISGGADSVCLLSVLKKLSKKLDFTLLACHYNHKLRGVESDKDERFVKEMCKEWGVGLSVARRNKKPCNSEDEARELRYNFFEKILEKSGGAKIAIAHNCNDLSETLLMRLIRGTGLRGLKSIPSKREKFIRPLLIFSRDEIIIFLEKEKIEFRTDKSNFDTKFLRNKIRHKLIPILKSYNRNIEKALMRLIKNSEVDYDFIENTAKEEFRKIAKCRDGKIELDRKKYLLLHDSVKYHILIKSFRDVGVFSDISSKHIEDINSMIEKNVGKKNLPLPHSLRVKLFGGKIVIVRG